MKDIQKIKEFFSQPMEAVTAAYKAKGEYFKPSIRKDKSNPNFLYVDIAYPEGSDVLSVGGSKTMSGQDRESGATKALSMGNAIVKKLQSKYNIEDIEVKDLKNGKVEVFAVSDDFIKMASPSLDEAMDVNDPVLMKARAAAFQRSQPKPEPTKPVKTINPDYKAVKNADKIKALKLKRAQLMRDMEQEAEPEGGPIADRYGALLNKIDQAMAKLSGQGDSETNVYMSKDEIDRRAAMMKEGEEETAVDMAKKQLDALGVEYEMSGNKFKPFKAIYKPSNEDLDALYDQEYELTRIYQNDKSEENWKKLSQIREKGKQLEKFDEIIYLFNLGSAVKSSMNEANGFKSGKDFINAKLSKYPKAVSKINQLIDMIGEDKFTIEMAEWVFDFFNNASFESPVNEATKDEETKFHKKLDKLVHNTFGKRKGEMEEAELTEEADQKQANNYAYQFMQYFDKMRRIVGGNFGDDTRKEFEKLVQSKFSKHTVNETEELTEAYVPSNIKEFAKRKGVSSLVNKVAGWVERVGRSINGGTAIGYNYSTLILDISHQGSEIRINTDNDTITLYDEPVNSFSQFKRVYDENNETSGNSLEERISEAFNKINEELCPAGKAYIKRRKASGEKSSAYLSGRAVKVCKGQMSGKAKKK
jgi:hypothetical protein